MRADDPRLERGAPGQERYSFPSLVEGLLRGLGPRFTLETKKKLNAAGLNVDRLPPAIPSAEMTRHMELMAREAWPDEPRIEALRLLGVHLIRGWQNTLLGSATAKMLQLIGPHRTLKRLDRVFSTTNNFSRATTELVDDKVALVTINDVLGMPSYWQGILEAGLELLGLEGTVTSESQEPPQGTFRLVWK